MKIYRLNSTISYCASVRSNLGTITKMPQWELLFATEHNDPWKIHACICSVFPVAKMSRRPHFQQAAHYFLFFHDLLMLRNDTARRRGHLSHNCLSLCSHASPRRLPYGWVSVPHGRSVHPPALALRRWHGLHGPERREKLRGRYSHVRPGCQVWLQGFWYGASVFIYLFI